MAQDVGVDEGVYRLARDAGFIVASVNQLVKGMRRMLAICWALIMFVSHIVLSWHDMYSGSSIGKIVPVRRHALVRAAKERGTRKRIGRD